MSQTHISIRRMDNLKGVFVVIFLSPFKEIPELHHKECHDLCFSQFFQFIGHITIRCCRALLTKTTELNPSCDARIRSDASEFSDDV
jgi:hypothetical protein